MNAQKNVMYIYIVWKEKKKKRKVGTNLVWKYKPSGKVELSKVKI